MAKRIRFKTSGGFVSFTTKKKKSKGKGGPKGKNGAFELWSIHDGGAKEVRRWKGSTEAAGEAKGRELAAAHGWLLDFVRRDGRRKVYLRSFGG